MKLHTFPEEFRDLIAIVADRKHLPESAIERDYYIVYLLKNLAESPFAEQCVFKGGTSLSKCYPGSIERFSEDIDLTFLGMDCTDKECDRAIKKIEAVMTVGAETEKINAERFNRSKSMYVWFGSKENQIKLEIGSSIRPDPFAKKPLKTYIQEYLEENGYAEAVTRYELEEIRVNALDITRTFVDKLMSVKRHAICGSMEAKVRHIYDITRLYQLPEIKAFLQDREELQRLMRITKETDAFYLNRRGISEEYDPKGPYDFPSWKCYLSDSVRKEYESLHRKFLYTDKKQDFDEAVRTFETINQMLHAIGE